MQMYLQRHFVGPTSLSTVDALLGEFKEYISRFPDVIKLTICLSGSYASGLSLREDSSLDLIVSMDGGQLTSSLDGDQLALALSTGLNDWEKLNKLTPVGSGTSLLIVEPKGSDLTLRIRTCKPSTFPINNLYHSQLFSSYSLCDPRVPAVVALVKHWARRSGYSRENSSKSSPFSGFHWTIIAIAFLIDANVVPNLHLLAAALPDAPREVFGPNPNSDSFVLVSDSAVGRRLSRDPKTQKLTVKQLLGQFFLWLAEIDLLATAIDIKAEKVAFPSPRKGWLWVADPTRAGECNTLANSTDQKLEVIFAMRLRRSAQSVLASLAQVTDEAEFTRILSARASVDGAVVKVDAAVP